MKTIISPSEGLKAGVRPAASGSAGTLPRYGAPASVSRAVRLPATELDRDFDISVDAIHARAETVTTVLESILHSQPVLPLNLL